MTLINEKVEHIKYGTGIIKEVKDNKLWVQFNDNIGTKVFLYPDAFEKFLKAVNPAVENDALEEWRRKQEQIELELEEKEREAAELKEIKLKLELLKKKSTVKSTRKKL